jgi:hypothetical protein
MKPFSQIYADSILVRTLAEKIPEHERQAFIEGVRSAMSEFDYLTLGSWNNSQIASLFQENAEEIPSQGTRRPPRRS